MQIRRLGWYLRQYSIMRFFQIGTMELMKSDVNAGVFKPHLDSTMMSALWSRIEKNKMRLVCVLFTFENNTGPTDGRTDGPTDRRTDTTSYRDATAHLKKTNLKMARAGASVFNNSIVLWFHPFDTYECVFSSLSLRNRTSFFFMQVFVFLYLCVFLRF